MPDRCRDCGTTLTAENVWEPGTCRQCARKLTADDLHMTPPNASGAVLEIDRPLAACGACGFTSALSGVWSIEDGRLVFRADADPLQRRGPDFYGCSESREPTEFTRITVDGRELSTEDVAALRATARSGSWRSEVE